MKSFINLYSDDLRPKLQVLTFPFVVTIWLLVVVLILLGSAWSHQHLSEAKQALSNSTLERDQLQTELKTYSDALTQRRPDQQLQRQLAAAEQLLQNNQALLAKLNENDRLISRDYPMLMTDLAAANHDDVWLSRIRVEGNQVFLQGTATHAEDVPEWIAQLGQQGFFTDVEFAKAQMQDNERHQVDFMLGAEPNQGGH